MKTGWIAYCVCILSTTTYRIVGPVTGICHTGGPSTGRRLSLLIVPVAPPSHPAGFKFRSTMDFCVCSPSAHTNPSSTQNKHKQSNHSGHKPKNRQTESPWTGHRPWPTFLPNSENGPPTAETNRTDHEGGFPSVSYRSCWSLLVLLVFVGLFGSKQEGLEGFTFAVRPPL